MRVPALSLGGATPASPRAGERVAASITVGFVACAVLYAFLTAMVSTPRQLTGLSADEQAAMSWSAANTAPSARFLIVSGDQWALDRTTEWFPVLAQRQSVVTTQGYEWRDGDSFRMRLKAYDDAQKCAAEGRVVHRDVAARYGHPVRLRLHPEAGAAHRADRGGRKGVLRGAPAVAPG